MYTCCLYSGKNHFEGHWKGWALKIGTFSGPEMKLPPSKALVQAPYKNKNKYIGNFMHMSFAAAVGFGPFEALRTIRSPENRYFLGGPKKSRFSGPTPSNGPWWIADGEGLGNGANRSDSKEMVLSTYSCNLDTRVQGFWLFTFLGMSAFSEYLVVLGFWK